MIAGPTASVTPEQRIRRLFVDHGVRGWLYAAAVDPGRAKREIAIDADVALPLASVWKLPLLVAYAHAVEDGTLDPTARTSLRPAERTGGAGGVSLLQDPVTISWRDLATSMISMSDNAAADAIHRKVGPARIVAAMDRLGLTDTHVRGDARTELQAVLRSTGAADADEAFRVLADADRPTDADTGHVLTASTSTPREIAVLLRALWTDTAASPEQCAFARAALARRLGPHRLRLGFPLDTVAVAEKSGTVGSLRHSAGVVQFAGERAYVVTVFTRAARADRILPGAEAAIGATAKIAVDALRTFSDR